MTSFQSTAYGSTASASAWFGTAADAMVSAGDVGTTACDALPPIAPPTPAHRPPVLDRWADKARTGRPRRLQASAALVLIRLLLWLAAEWERLRQRTPDEWVARLLPLPETIDDGAGVRFARWGPVLAWSGAAAAALFAGGAVASAALGGWYALVEFLAFTLFAVSLVLGALIASVTLIVIWYVMR